MTTTPTKAGRAARGLPPSENATQRTVAVDRIDRDPDQPRKHFDETALDELAHSIKEFGILTPVTLRYHKATRRYTLVAGERRWRAAQRAGLDMLPALVLGDLDDESAFRRSIAENLNRADVTPLEEAAAFQRLVDAGYETAQIGQWYGKSPEYVTWRIDLLGLVPAAREAVNKRQLPVGLAWYVCRLTPDNQHRFLTKWANGAFASVRDAEAFAQACRDVEAQPSFFALEEPDEEQTERIRAGQRQLLTELDRLERAISAANTLQATHVDDLAQYLAGVPGGIGAYTHRVETMLSYLRRLRGNLRKAAAHTAVTVELNPDAIAS